MAFQLYPSFSFKDPGVVRFGVEFLDLRYRRLGVTWKPQGIAVIARWEEQDGELYIMMPKLSRGFFPDQVDLLERCRQWLITHGTAFTIVQELVASTPVIVKKPPIKKINKFQIY